MQSVRLQVAGAIAAGFAVQGLLPLLEFRAGLVFDNILLALIALFTTVGHIMQTRQCRGRRRWAWSLAAFAAGLWSASSMIDTVGALRSTDTALDEVLALGAAIFSMVALVLVSTARRGKPGDRLPRFLDVATVSGALIILAWDFILGPAYTHLPGNGGLLIVLVLLPELIGAAYAVVILSRSLSNHGDVALRLLALGWMGFAVTLLLSVHNVVQELPWYASGVGAGYVIAGLVNTLASRAPIPPETFTEQSQGDVRWALLPYLPVVLAFAAAAWRYVRTGNVTAVLFWLLLATATLVLVRQFLNLRAIQRLTEDLRHQRAEFAHQAAHDSLTGLSNRVGFQYLAENALAAAGPDGLTGVLVIDLDGFKEVNDTYGHRAGDALLVGVAARLRAGVRSNDTVARLGGDEFAVVLSHLKHPNDVHAIGANLLTKLAEPIDVGGNLLTARGSIGATVGVGTQHEPLELVEQADVALYEAKAAGKGVLRCYVSLLARSRDGSPAPAPATKAAASSATGPVLS